MPDKPEITPEEPRRVTKRVNAYTSTSIGRDKIAVLNNLRAYLKEVHGLVTTNQAINDLAIDRAWAQREEFAKEFTALDPDLAAYLKLQAKLKAAGKI